jgi:hypothetical protein
MRIHTKVVWAWTCLSAFTFIHTAAAQDYSADPFSQSPAETGTAAADYSGEDSSLEGSLPYGSSGGSLDPAAYQNVYSDGPVGVYPDGTPMPYDAGGVPYGDPNGPYPPPVASQPGTGYWPQVSPYDTRVRDSTYRENGIWVNNSVYGDRKYLMSVEYLRTWFNRPGTDTIGAGGVGPDPLLPDYNTVTSGVFSNGHDLVSDGVRGKFIIQNADNTTFEASGWWTAEGNSVYEPFGKGNSGNPDTFRPRGVITYNDGTRTGTAVPYDTDFKLGYKEQAFGADMIFSTTPFIETEGFRIRALWGGKYVKVREQFSFHGEDSALQYAFQPGGPPVPGTILPNPLGLPNYSSDMVSRTTSDLAGPEIGVRYELGGKHILFWGQSRLAVAANHEVISLYGNQMGDGFGTGFPPPTAADPKPAYFNHQVDRTKVSPIFSQDFYAKGKVFKHIPILKKVPLIAEADMLVGYNFMLIGGMARPTKIIDYRLNDPRINLNNSRWLMQNVTFGLQWQF